MTHFEIYLENFPNCTYVNSVALICHKAFAWGKSLETIQRYFLARFFPVWTFFIHQSNSHIWKWCGRFYIVDLWRQINHRRPNHSRYLWKNCENGKQKAIFFSVAIITSDEKTNKKFSPQERGITNDRIKIIDCFDKDKFHKYISCVKTTHCVV